MKLKLNEKQIKTLLKYYYKEYENIDCDINIEAKIDYVGIYEERACVVVITQTRKIFVAGEETLLELELTKQDVKDKLQAVLQEQKLEIYRYIYESDIIYGDRDRQGDIDTPYFNGITLEVKTMEKERQLVR